MAILRHRPGIAAPNLAEALVQCVRRGHALGAQQIATQLVHAGIQVVPVQEQDVIETTRLLLHSEQLVQQGVLERPISLGDATCLAVATRLNIQVVCSDKAWNSLAVPVKVTQIR